jgi:DNA-binding XRE family transcriptional regulator
MQYNKYDYKNYDYSIVRKAGSRVRALMNPEKDSVASLALVVNVSPSHMSKLLDDKCEWSMEKAFSISEYFGVPFEYIYYGIDIFSGVNEANFIAQFKGTLMHVDKLPEEEKRVCYREMANKLSEVFMRCIGEVE